MNRYDLQSMLNYFAPSLVQQSVIVQNSLREVTFEHNLTGKKCTLVLLQDGWWKKGGK